MIIKLDQILNFLKNSKIRYRVIGEPYEHFTIASLFNPVMNGFYFFTGNSVFTQDISNSLILIESELAIGKKPINNAFILVDNAQKVFYQLMSSLYSKKSTGLISSSAEISAETNMGVNVEIGSFSIVEANKIGKNTKIGRNCTIHANVEIGDGVTIEDGSIIGTTGVAWIWDEIQKERIIQPQIGGVKIGNNCFLGANTIVVRGSLNENTEIGNDVLIAPGCRLGHGTRIGSYTHLANGVITGGNANIGNNCFVGSGVIFRPKVSIDNETVVGAGAVVVKNTSKPRLTLIGVPAKESVTNEVQSGIPKLIKK